MTLRIDIDISAVFFGLLELMGNDWSSWESHRPLLEHIPSSQHTKTYGKSPFLMGKSTINDHLSIVMLVYL